MRSGVSMSGNCLATSYEDKVNAPLGGLFLQASVKCLLTSRCVPYHKSWSLSSSKNNSLWCWVAVTWLSLPSISTSLQMHGCVTR